MEASEEVFRAEVHEDWVWEGASWWGERGLALRHGDFGVPPFRELLVKVGGDGALCGVGEVDVVLDTLIEAVIGEKGDERPCCGGVV